MWHMNNVVQFNPIQNRFQHFFDLTIQIHLSEWIVQYKSNLNPTNISFSSLETMKSQGTIPQFQSHSQNFLNTTDSEYRVCHGFQINKAGLLFLDQFRPLFNPAVFLQATQAVLIIGTRLKPSHHWEIYLTQIIETPCSIKKKLGVEV